MAEGLRWRLAGDDAGQGSLFDADELLDRHFGTGEFKGIEFLHVNARRIINEVPASSRMPFRYTINAYRGCSHACSYCSHPDTPILMGDGSIRRIADVRVGETVYGTRRVGNYRRYIRTPILDHWSNIQEAWRVVLEDGTELVASGDHRFLTNRGWKHVSGTGAGPNCRPHLTLTNELLGTGHFAEEPKDTPEYRRGYLCGMIRGDGYLGHYSYSDPRKSVVHSFRLALVDVEPLDRVRRYLDDVGVELRSRVFSPARPGYKEVLSVYTGRKEDVALVEALIAWPTSPSPDWSKGFLAGIFDAEGCFSGCVRISNKDLGIIGQVRRCLAQFGLVSTVEGPNSIGCYQVRLVGGIVEVLRFLHTTGPVIARKRNLDGRAIKNNARLRVVSIERLGIDIPMYDITTGTGDFIANGVVSHNCFARPTHEYLGLNIGSDFESKIVVKINAVERVRAELAGPKWAGDPIAMGTNTDPYQRCEGKYHLTRGIVEEMSRARNPFSILTKSTLVLRDLDLLAEASKRTTVRVSLSIGTLDEEVWRATEPGTPHPRQRVNAVRKLSEAGVETGVLVAPVIPGMSDGRAQVREVVQACRDAGAQTVSTIGLHLRPGVREHFMGWLEEARPDLVPQYRRLYGKGSYLPEAAQERLAAVASESGRLRRGFTTGHERESRGPAPPPSGA